MTTEQVDKKVFEHVDGVHEKYPENDVLYCGLYGSQNYGMDTEASDVDTKAMLLPTTKEVILGKKRVSAEVEMADGSLCTVKDVRGMFDEFMKNNTAFIEILYTKYALTNVAFVEEVGDLREHRDLLANHDPLRLMHQLHGLGVQKYVAFEKPFAGKLDILDKYGYDLKQLHHLCRVRHFMEDYMDYKDYSSCLMPMPEVRDEILKLKTTPLPYYQAKNLLEEEREKLEDLLLRADAMYGTDEWKFITEKRTKEAREYLDDLAYRVISKQMVREQKIKEKFVASTGAMLKSK